MQDDIQAVKDKYDAKIQNARERLDELIATKQSKIAEIKEYYDALDSIEKADKIIKKGKPKV